MACGPAPCLTIWRNPRVLGFAGASRAATPEPEGRALIAIVLSSLLYASAATAGAAAILAFVACAVRHHQHAAFAACRRMLQMRELRQHQRLQLKSAPPELPAPERQRPHFPREPRHSASD